jgi:hypothetical protein
MSLPYERRAYDDADTTAQMHADAVATRIRLAEAAAPSILFEDYAESPKPEITISEATARLAASLHLHLD